MAPGGCAETTVAPVDAVLATLASDSVLRRALETRDAGLLFASVWTLDPGHAGFRLWRLLDGGTGGTCWTSWPPIGRCTGWPSPRTLPCGGSTMGATKEANLISAVLRYAVRCLADGDREALRAMNFGPKEIEALAAWYDHVITDTNGEIALAEERLSAPIAVVDIGGRATDYVVVADRSGRGPRRLRLAALRPAGREEAGRGWHPRQV